MLSCPLETICPDSTPYWRDVGTLDAYYEANMDVLADPPVFDLRDSRWAEGSRFEEWIPSKVPGQRSAAARNLVASGCDIAPASIDRSIFSPGVKVGEGSEIDGCILFPGVTVGRGVRLRRVIVEEGVHIPDGVQIDAKNARHCTVSEGGVVVVAAGYRFEEPTSVVTREASGEPEEARKKAPKKKAIPRIASPRSQPSPSPRDA